MLFPKKQGLEGQGCSENKSERNGRNRSKSEQIGVFPSPPNVAAPNVSREHRPFFRFRFPFSVVSGPSCQQFRTLFRSSFRLRPKIPYLIPEFTFLSFSWVLRAAGSFVFSVFSAFSGFQGAKSGIPVFPFFPLLGAPNLEFRGHGSGHVWCGHVWRAQSIPENKEPKSEENCENGTNRNTPGLPLFGDPKPGALNKSQGQKTGLA